MPVRETKRGEVMLYQNAFKILKMLGEIEHYRRADIEATVQIRMEDNETPITQLIRKYVELNKKMLSNPSKAAKTAKAERLTINRPLKWDREMQLAAQRAQYQPPVISVNSAKETKWSW